MTAHIPTKEISLTMDNVCITGKDVIITEMSINTSERNVERFNVIGERCIKLIPSRVEIELKMVCRDKNFFMETLDGNYKQDKIRYKKVKDCTINELLFAVQHKLKN